MAQKILLVEDDPCFGSVLKSYLELSDYEVTLCVNGNDGLEAFRKDKFDICLLDVMMPEMDGIEAVKQIKAVNPAAKVIMCSAMGQQSMVMDAIKAGANDFIVKPFQADRVLEAVKKIVG